MFEKYRLSQEEKKFWEELFPLLASSEQTKLLSILENEQKAAGNHQNLVSKKQEAPSQDRKEPSAFIKAEVPKMKPSLKKVKSPQSSRSQSHITRASVRDGERIFEKILAKLGEFYIDPAEKDSLYRSFLDFLYRKMKKNDFLSVISNAKVQNREKLSELLMKLSQILILDVPYEEVLKKLSERNAASEEGRVFEKLSKKFGESSANRTLEDQFQEDDRETKKVKDQDKSEANFRNLASDEASNESKKKNSLHDKAHQDQKVVEKKDFQETDKSKTAPIEKPIAEGASLDNQTNTQTENNVLVSERPSFQKLQNINLLTCRDINSDIAVLERIYARTTSLGFDVKKFRGGWQASEVYRVYDEMGRHSVINQMNIQEVIQDFRMHSRPYLLPAQFELVKKINEALL